jgi:hypothetical protein
VRQRRVGDESEGERMEGVSEGVSEGEGEGAAAGPMIVSWGTDVNVTQVMASFKRFFEQFTTTQQPGHNNDSTITITH